MPPQAGGRDDEQHPWIDNAQVDFEVRTHDRATHQTNDEPDGETFEHWAVAVLQHHSLDLAGCRAQRHPYPDFFGAMADQVRPPVFLYGMPDPAGW